MTYRSEIRRRADGSIDTEFYMDRARQLRSTEMHEAASATRRALGRLFLEWLRRVCLRPPGDAAQGS